MIKYIYIHLDALYAQITSSLFVCLRQRGISETGTLAYFGLVVQYDERLILA